MKPGQSFHRQYVRRILYTLYFRQHGRCHYCDKPMFLTNLVGKKYAARHRANQATFDHVIPKSKGGKWVLQNGVCACFSCNTARGDVDYWEFKSLTMRHKARLTNGATK